MSEAIDVDGDGEITKEEFIKNAMECEFVCDMLQVMMMKMMIIMMMIICDMLQVGIAGDSDDEEEEDDD